MAGLTGLDFKKCMDGFMAHYANPASWDTSDINSNRLGTLAPQGWVCGDVLHDTFEHMLTKGEGAVGNLWKRKHIKAGSQLVLLWYANTDLGGDGLHWQLVGLPRGWHAQEKKELGVVIDPIGVKNNRAGSCVPAKLLLYMAADKAGVLQQQQPAADEKKKEELLTEKAKARPVVSTWREGMGGLLGSAAAEFDAPVPKLQEDGYDCGPWVCLLAHLAVCTATGRVTAQEAVGMLGELRGCASGWRAVMLAVTQQQGVAAAGGAV